MPPLGRSLCLLLLFFAFSAALQEPFTYQSLQKCAKIVVKPKRAGDKIMTSEYVKKEGEMVTVVGITRNCVFFMGHLHNILEENENSTETVPFDPSLESECAKVKAYLVKDARHQNRIAITVKVDGTRIRVQQAVNGKAIKHNNQAIYMEVDVNNRHDWIHTHSVDKGYQILRVTSLEYKVFVVTRNHYEIRLYELIVGTSLDNELYADLKALVGFDPILADPTDDRMVTAASLLDASNQVEDADDRITHGADYDIYPPLSSQDLKRVNGFTIYSRNYDLRDENAAMMVPLVSLISETYRGVSFADKHKERAAGFRKDKLIISKHSCLYPIHHVEFYYHKMKKTSEYLTGDKYEVPDATSVGFWIENTRFINEGATHRRMAYPHTRFQPKRTDSGETTTQYLLGITGTFVVMMIISFIWNNIALCIRWRFLKHGTHSSGSHHST